MVCIVHALVWLLMSEHRQQCELVITEYRDKIPLYSSPHIKNIGSTVCTKGLCVVVRRINKQQL